MSSASIDHDVRVEASEDQVTLAVRPAGGRVQRAQVEALVDAMAELAARAAATSDPRAVDLLIEQLRALAPARPSSEERWNETIGPFYDTAGLEKWLGTSRQRLHQRVQSGQLLAVKAGNGSLYYPAWQFTGTGNVVPGLPEIIAGLGSRSALNKALWLRSPRAEFGDRAAIDVLAHGNPADVRAIVSEARADGERWAR